MEHNIRASISDSHLAKQIRSTPSRHPRRPIGVTDFNGGEARDFEELSQFAANSSSVPREVEMNDFYVQGNAIEMWADSSMWNTRRLREGDFFARLCAMKELKRVLDVGCAAGFSSIELARRNSSIEVDGIDILETAIERAKNLLLELPQDISQRVRFFTRDWYFLDPISIVPYDAIFCLGSSLHHEKRKNVPVLIGYWKTKLSRVGYLVIEQRNYDRLFRLSPASIETSFGSKCHLDYVDEHALTFHYLDDSTSVNARITCEVLFEEELLNCVTAVGFTLVGSFYDFGASNFEDSDWCQYIFQVR